MDGRRRERYRDGLVNEFRNEKIKINEDEWKNG